MSLTKKEIWRRLEAVKDEFQSALDEARLQWLRKVLAEAQQRYSFKTTGEFVGFMFDHCDEVSPKSDDS
jgi:hypothetical protein